MTILASLAAATLLAVNTVPFNQAPSEVTARLAGVCMERGFSVVELTDRQVRCEIGLQPEHKATILFTRFHQRSYGAGDVHHYVNFVVAPSGSGSLVQHRQWYEASINGAVRTADVTDRRLVGQVQDTLVSLAR